MKTLPPCVFPSPTEVSVVTVPGPEAGVAYRLRVEAGRDGYLRIEQLAYNAQLGWYTQKTFCLPGDVVHQLMPHLKQAAAMIPRPTRSSLTMMDPAAPSSDTCLSVAAALPHDAPLRFPGPVSDDPTPADVAAALARKEA